MYATGSLNWRPGHKFCHKKVLNELRDLSACGGHIPGKVVLSKMAATELEGSWWFCFRPLYESGLSTGPETKTTRHFHAELPSLSGKRDSDPRPQPWQGCALPTELFPQNVSQNGTANISRFFESAKFFLKSSEVSCICTQIVHAGHIDFFAVFGNNHRGGAFAGIPGGIGFGCLRSGECHIW